jgi:TatD DNase family protein
VTGALREREQVIARPRGTDVPDLIDTHAHLDSEQLAADLPAVIARARAAGVVQMIAVGITAPSSAACVELASAHEGVFATVGVHPNDAAEAAPGARDEVLRLLDRPRVVGVGETGLDRYWDRTPFAVQEEWFAWHLEIGRTRRLPVVIHCRDAEADVLRMLRQEYDRHGPIEGVMHSFVGSQATAEACLAMGLYLSFAGMLTYKNAANVREVAAKAPPDRVLVETDCPYLSPVPMRGKRNEPANVVHTAACLAEVLQIGPDEAAGRTTANARRLFGLPAS